MFTKAPFIFAIHWLKIIHTCISQGLLQGKYDAHRGRLRWPTVGTMHLSCPQEALYVGCPIPYLDDLFFPCWLYESSLIYTFILFSTFSISLSLVTISCCLNPSHFYSASNSLTLIFSQGIEALTLPLKHWVPSSFLIVPLKPLFLHFMKHSGQNIAIFYFNYVSSK